MAVPTLTAETELLYDALESLSRLKAELTHRHGDVFRRLDADIEAAFRILKPTDIGHQPLSPGRLVFTPPAAWLDLIARGRALGVKL
jgi:hypothetical protein